VDNGGILDYGAWVVFWCLLPLLWVNGMQLFRRSSLPAAKKVAWSLFLVSVGVAIGVLLPMRGIRDRFLIVVALIPVLALIDIRLARSNRSFLFWARACSFEVCTVFACAALTRAVIALWWRAQGGT